MYYEMNIDLLFLGDMIRTKRTLKSIKTNTNYN